MNWTRRQNKATVRSYMFEWLRLSRETPLQSYLCLPGWDETEEVGGVCIETGIQSGMITPETHILAYEQEPEQAAKIATYFKTKKLKLEFHHLDVLTSSDLPPLDFAFLDFCGAVKTDLYHWLQQELLPALTPNSFALTVAIGRCEGALFDVAKASLESNPNFRKQFLTEFYLWKEISPEPLVAVWLYIIKCALRDYDNRLFQGIYYLDGHHPMICFLFDVGQRLDNNQPRVFPDLGKEPLMKSLSRSEIAIKAAETRAANIEKARRSEIANRAVATRRKNALFAKRSAAAHRAVKTRRANASK